MNWLNVMKLSIVAMNSKTTVLSLDSFLDKFKAN